ncbi:MAG: leucine-rich repeat domain-containing protein, partial [Campylobacterales bacterium]|nr:leucine-rich repeat domain-containing protein [Campylobacterales bacterium]
MNLNSNQITDITPLKDLKNLTALNLESNKIADITPLKDLKKLTELYLSDNPITDITPLKDLKNLTTLYLNDNKITDITPLKDLKNLTKLVLSDNQIKFFPKELLDLNLEIKLKYDYKVGIILEDNPIEEPPMEIMAKGRDAIVEYFASLEEGQEKINELKILIVGHGESGKTSLLKRILGKEFDPKEHQTYGIEIHQKEIVYSDREVKANFLDFGGQKIMHSTHQFFFTERSFYLLVLDGRAEEDAEYWFKHIESFGGDSPIMLVLNKINQNPSFDVDRKHLRDKYNIKGFYPVSCQTNEGVEALMEALSQEILKVDLIEYPFPSKWLKVKKQLEASTQNYISYENFEAVCIKEGISKKSTQDTLMGFLHDLGVALHFKELELLDTFVLNPIWVTEAVYKIINDKEVIANKGGFSATMLQRILHEDKFPHHKFLFIVDVMKKFEVCYQIEKESYLIPSLFDIQ